MTVNGDTKRLGVISGAVLAVIAIGSLIWRSSAAIEHIDGKVEVNTTKIHYVEDAVERGFIRIEKQMNRIEGKL